MSEQEDPPFQPALMSFCKNGKTGHFDIFDGRFDYRGDLPASDAAKLLFEKLVKEIDESWLERARSK
jgi:hypothetical protein